MIKKSNNILGILGNPLRQSMSPFLHNYWLKQNSLQYYYCKFQIENIKDINKAIVKLNIKGLNVTIPFKKKILKYLDNVDDISSSLRAVNTIKNNNGKLQGYNTDVKGFLKGLSKLKKININKPALILGAGGASEAVIYSLREKGLKNIYLMNRTRKKAEIVAERQKKVIVKSWMQKDAINSAGLFVNATSLGMIGYPDLPISLNEADKDTKIYDVVYNPQETKLIKEAKANRLDYVTGLSMFLGQAQESFKIWFNINPKINDYLKKRIKIKIKNS